MCRLSLLLLAGTVVCCFAKPARQSGWRVAAHQRTSIAPALPHVPLPSNFIAVPLYEQEKDYSCGPSSALALLRYWDWNRYHNVTEKELYSGFNVLVALVVETITDWLFFQGMFQLRSCVVAYCLAAG